MSLDNDIVIVVEGYTDVDHDGVRLFRSVQGAFEAWRSLAENHLSLESLETYGHGWFQNQLHASPIILPRRRRKYDALLLLYLAHRSGIRDLGGRTGLEGLVAEATRLGLQTTCGVATATVEAQMAMGPRDQLVVVEPAPNLLKELRRGLDHHTRALISRGDPVELALAFVVAEREAKKMKLTIVELTAERDALVQANTLRKSGKGHLSLAGDYRLWRSRNYGHSSATALLQILQTKGYKELVLKSERRGGAAHYVLGRRLAAQAFAASASWSVIVIRTDAFSSSAARTDAHKLQVTEIIFAIEGSSGTKRRERHRLIPDLMDVLCGSKVLPECISCFPCSISSSSNSITCFA